MLAAHLLLYVVYYLYLAVTPGGSIPAGGSVWLLVVIYLHIKPQILVVLSMAKTKTFDTKCPCSHPLYNICWIRWEIERANRRFNPSQVPQTSPSLG
jgi:hypothetical protein